MSREPTRSGTAVAITEIAFPAGASVACLATRADVPGALAGAVAAARDGGPPLPTAWDVVPDATAAELTRLGPARVVEPGGASLVSLVMARVAAGVL